MKNKFILLLLLLLNFNAYALNCENDLTKNYNFNYEFTNNRLNYTVTSKSKENISYLSKIDNGISSSIGFYILPPYNTGQEFYSNSLLRGNFGILKNSATNKSFFVTKDKINESIKIDHLVNSFRPLFNINDTVEKIDVIFKLTLILDSEVKSCAVFETKPISYKLKFDFIDKITNFFN